MEHDRPTIGVAVFVRKSDQFLMLQRTGAHGAGTWSVPGGHLEYGESIEECAAREVLEEVGLSIGACAIAAVTNDIFHDNHKHSVTVWVESTIKPGSTETARICEADKILDLAWCSFDNLPSPLFEPCWQNLRKQKPELFKT